MLHRLVCDSLLNTKVIYIVSLPRGFPVQAKSLVFDTHIGLPRCCGTVHTAAKTGPDSYYNEHYVSQYRGITVNTPQYEFREYNVVLEGWEFRAVVALRHSVHH